jgi:hypothetical protein
VTPDEASIAARRLVSAPLDQSLEEADHQHERAWDAGKIAATT